MMLTQSLDFKYFSPFGYILSVLHPLSLSDRLTTSESVPYVMNVRAQCTCGSISHSHRPRGARGLRTLCVCGCVRAELLCACVFEWSRAHRLLCKVCFWRDTRFPTSKRRLKGSPSSYCYEFVSIPLSKMYQWHRINCCLPADNFSVWWPQPDPSCLPTSQVLPPLNIKLNVSLLCVLASNQLVPQLFSLLWGVEHSVCCLL